MKTISLRLPERLDAALEVAARKAGRSKSDLTRAAVEAYLEGLDGGGAGSCLDLARDLAGCVEGPGDLSTNAKHLQGYGR